MSNVPISIDKVHNRMYPSVEVIDSKTTLAASNMGAGVNYLDNPVQEYQPIL